MLPASRASVASKLTKYLKKVLESSERVQPVAYDLVNIRFIFINFRSSIVLIKLINLEIWKIYNKFLIAEIVKCIILI